MTTIQSVISPLNVPTFTNTTNVVMPPAGDKYVFLNNAGFLQTDYPLTMGSVALADTITSAALAQTNSNEQILRGTWYGGAAATLNASDLDPRKLMIIGSGVASGQTTTIPDASVILNYLKNTFGPENILPGLYWKITFLNDTSGNSNDWTIRVNPAAGAGNSGTITPIGFVVNGGVTTTLIPGSGSSNTQKNSFTFHFLITNVKVGQEAITIICTTG